MILLTIKGCLSGQQVKLFEDTIISKRSDNFIVPPHLSLIVPIQYEIALQMFFHLNLILLSYIVSDNCRYKEMTISFKSRYFRNFLPIINLFQRFM